MIKTQLNIVILFNIFHLILSSSVTYVQQVEAVIVLYVQIIMKLI